MSKSEWEPVARSTRVGVLIGDDLDVGRISVRWMDRAGQTSICSLEGMRRVSVRNRGVKGTNSARRWTNKRMQMMKRIL